MSKFGDEIDDWYPSFFGFDNWDKAKLGSKSGSDNRNVKNVTLGFKIRIKNLCSYPIFWVRQIRIFGLLDKFSAALNRATQLNKNQEEEETKARNRHISTRAQPSTEAKWWRFFFNHIFPQLRFPDWDKFCSPSLGTNGSLITAFQMYGTLI